MYRKQKIFWQNNYILFLIIIGTILADQFSKSYYINLFESQEIAPYKLLPFLNFDYVWNKGVSFGFFAKWEHSNYIFITLAVLISWYFIKLFLQEANKRLKLSYSLIIGGAIGNIIDRIRYGAVFDFIDIHINDLHWPAFNLADSFITIGGVLLIINLFSAKIDKNEINKL